MCFDSPTVTMTATLRKDDAYQRILWAIIFGDLAPGMPVDEKHLSAELDIGLASIRSALYRLSLEGLVERHARIGTNVSRMEITELQDVFEARMLFEGGCARMAAQRATSADIAALRSAFSGYEDVIKKKDFRRLLRMDREFHRALFNATRNRILISQLGTLYNIAARFWFFSLPRMQTLVLTNEIEIHLDVIDAIEQGNADAAERAMRVVLEQFPSYVDTDFREAMS